MIIKYLLKNFYWMILLCWAIYVSITYRIQEHQIYLKYNNMHGVVIDNFVSQGRYGSTSLPTIRLDDGTVESVNGGNTNYQIGDTFVNEMNFNWIFGITGTAYFIVPGENIFKVIVCITIELCLFVLVIVLVCWGILKWDVYVNRKYK